MSAKNECDIPRGKNGAERATERSLAAGREALSHLRAAQIAIERSISLADLVSYGTDMPEETAARVRDLEDGESSARGRIASAIRKVASWVGLLEHADGGRYKGQK